MEHYFNTKLAERYGIAEAVILHTLYFWIRKNALAGRNIEDGKVWTFSSARVLSEWFTYLNEAKIYRIITYLLKHEIISKGNYNQSRLNHTAWYSFTDKGIKELASCGYDITIFQNLENDVIKIQNRICENTKTLKDSINKDIRVKECVNNISNVREDNKEMFEQWWNAYGKKVGKKDTARAWDRLTNAEQEKCIEVVGEYVNATPDVQYRMNPLTYLHRRAWEDEIIKRTIMTNDYGTKPYQNSEDAERERRMQEYAQVAAGFLQQNAADRARRNAGIESCVD